MAGEPKSTEAGEEDDFVVPAGAPIRVADWLAPPLILGALAIGVLWFVMQSHVETWQTAFIGVMGAVTVGAAVTQAMLGYRAFRDMTYCAVKRYQAAGLASLGTLGVLTVFGTLPVSVVLLGVAGYRAGVIDARPVRSAARLLSPAGWYRLAVWSGILTVVVTLAKPLTQGIGIVPLEIVTALVAVGASFIAGFAYRLCPERYRFF